MSQKGEWDDKSTSNPWYVHEFPPLSETALKVFTEYARIPETEIEPHLRAFRDQAWKIAPYPCVGTWNFLAFNTNTVPEYAEVVRRVKAGEKFLDVGCGIGQDLRLLASDGADTSAIYASDTNTSFYEAGYGLFRDRTTFKASFIEATLPKDAPKFNFLKGQLSFIHAGSFFHLFDLGQQKVVAKELLPLLNGANSLIFGRQVGTRKQPVFQHMVQGSCYRHTTASIEAFWTDVASAAGLHVQVTASYQDFEAEENVKFAEQPGFEEDPLCTLLFAARFV